MYEIIETPFHVNEVFNYLTCILQIVHLRARNVYMYINNIANCLKPSITYYRQICRSFNARVVQWLERRGRFESHCT
jgi:hypothetical protein